MIEHQWPELLEKRPHHENEDTLTKAWESSTKQVLTHVPTPNSRYEEYRPAVAVTSLHTVVLVVRGGSFKCCT